MLLRRSGLGGHRRRSAAPLSASRKAMVPPSLGVTFLASSSGAGVASRIKGTPIRSIIQVCSLSSSLTFCLPGWLGGDHVQCEFVLTKLGLGNLASFFSRYSSCNSWRWWLGLMTALMFLQILCLPGLDVCLSQFMVDMFILNRIVSAYVFFAWLSFVYLD